MTFAGCNSPGFVGVKMDASAMIITRKERVSDNLSCSINKLLTHNITAPVCHVIQIEQHKTWLLTSQLVYTKRQSISPVDYELGSSRRSVCLNTTLHQLIWRKTTRVWHTRACWRHVLWTLYTTDEQWPTQSSQFNPVNTQLSCRRDSARWGCSSL